MARLLLDTNVFLHYRSISEIDWRALAGVEDVEIVVVMPVVHELDVKKSDASLGERAKRVIKELSSLRADGGRIRERVALRFEPCEVSPAEVAPPLVFEHRDDQMVVLAKRCARLGGPIRVVTEDLGLQIKCDQHGVPWMEPPAASRLEDPAGPLARQLRAAQSKVAKFEARRPHLEVLFSGAEKGTPLGGEMDAVLPSPHGSDITTALERYKGEHAQATPKERAGRSVMWLSVPSSDDLARYNEKLEKHFEEYRRYLEQLDRFHTRVACRLVRFSVWLQNAGTSPAGCIDVEVSFSSDDVVMVSEFDDDGLAWYLPPPAPELPSPPRSPFDRRGMQALDPTWVLPRTPAAQMFAAELNRDVVRMAVEGGRDTGCLISARVKSLRHDDRQRLGDFVLLLKERTPLRPFEVPYTIRDDVNMEPTTGRVVLKPRHVAQ